METKKLPNAKPLTIDGTYHQSLSKAAKAHFVSRITLRNYITGKLKRSVLEGLRVELVK